MMRQGLAVLCLGGLALLFTACGGDKGDDESDGLDEGGASGRAAAVEDVDVEVARTEVVGLLEQYDTVVNAIIADPAVARDRANALIQQYLALFEPNSNTAEELIDAWVGRADEGLTTTPLGDGPIAATRLDGDIEVRAADEVVFPICVARNFVVNDAQGQVRDQVPDHEQAGEGVAVLVDGRWLLRERILHEDTATCGSEGS